MWLNRFVERMTCQTSLFVFSCFVCCFSFFHAGANPLVVFCYGAQMLNVLVGPVYKGHRLKTKKKKLRGKKKKSNQFVLVLFFF